MHRDDIPREEQGWPPTRGGRRGQEGGHVGGPGGGRGRHGGPRGRGGPYGPRGEGRIRRGDVRGLLLAGLLDGPAHGYELMGRLEEQSGGRWRPSPGSVYPQLQQLQDEGLVRAVDHDGRKI